MGSVKSERKAKTSAENGKLGGHPFGDMAQIKCSCSVTAAAGVAPELHRKRCNLYQAWKRRMAKQAE